MRISTTKHRLLSEVAASWELSLSAVAEQLIDQLLFQTCEEYEAPEWLLRAVQDELLPIKRYEDPDQLPADNLVKFVSRG